MVVVQGDPDLFEVVDALCAACSLARALNGGQEKRYQHRDDRNHDQQFDERESGTWTKVPFGSLSSHW
jgi:hypothetical protein